MDESINAQPEKWLFKNAFFKITLVGAILFCLFILWINYRYKISVEVIDNDIKTQMKQLPMVLSEEVTMLSIERQESLILLKYEIQDQSDSELVSYYKEIDLKEEFEELCKAVDFRLILAKGFIWEHLYLSKDGVEVSRAQLTERVCDEIS